MKIWVGVVFLFFSLSALAQITMEPPYPETAPTGEDKEVEKPIGVDPRGGYLYNPEKKEEAIRHIPGVQSPVERESDGAYYYGKEKRNKGLNKIDGVTTPQGRGRGGSYYYGGKSKSKKVEIDGVQKPGKVTSDGAYLYDIEPENYTTLWYFRAGVSGPYDVRSADAGANVNFENVYSSNPGALLMFDYEWKLFDFLGAFLVKVGSGLNFYDGKGRFGGTTYGDLEPRETFSFLVFPNTFSVSYKFEWSDTQKLVPYVDGGVGYYTFWERRSDGEVNNLGGAPVVAFSGGLLLSMKMFGNGGMTSEYGFSNSWVDLHYRQVIGLDERKDFTSSMITLGVAVGF